MSTLTIKQIAEINYEAYKRGDVDTILNNLHENVIWNFPGYPEIPYAGTYKGRENTRAFFSRVKESMDVSEFIINKVIMDDNIVIGMGTAKAKTIPNSVQVDMNFIHVMEFDGDHIIKMNAYYDTQTIAKAFLHK